MLETLKQALSDKVQAALDNSEDSSAEVEDEEEAGEEEDVE
jgi:hypothetical protein